MMHMSNAPHDCTYHCDHAIVLFPGPTAAKEGDEENHHTHSNQDDGNYWSWRISDQEGFVQSHMNQDAHDNQR